MMITLRKILAIAFVAMMVSTSFILMITPVVNANSSTPAISIPSPANGATVTATHPTVTWSASVASGIAYYDIVRDGGNWVHLSSGQTSYTTQYALADGTHTMTVRAVDDAGNYADATVVFTVSTTTVDTTPPSITITSPANGATTSANHPTISWTASDASGIAYYQIVRDGGNWVTLSSGQTSYTTQYALADGSHTVTVRAVDNAGNHRDVTTVFNVGFALGDNMAPSLKITSPANGATIADKHATVTWTASDASGIAYYKIMRDGGSWVTLSSSTTSYTTITELADGSHTMTVEAVDNVGNTVAATTTFTVSIASTSTNGNDGVRQITFAGMVWNVSAYGDFSDSSSVVWVDSNGYLHLKCTQVNGVWKAAEVVTANRLGHGYYEYTLQGDQHNLDKNLVLGMFAYKDITHEVDAELSYWGDTSNPNMAYTVQPGPPPANMQQRWTMAETGTTLHSFNWAPNHVLFASYATGSRLLASFDSSASASAEGARGIINLWMYQNNPPAQETEIVIQNFIFIPEAY
jgi:hypothetical protein